MSPAGSKETSLQVSSSLTTKLAFGLIVLAVAIATGAVARSFGLWPKPATAELPRLSELLQRTITDEGIDAAVARYRVLREQGFPGARESEGNTNGLGYKLLGKRETRAAIQLFQLNIETHPGSANAHDSLGEAYLAAGERELAIASFERALAIEPNHKSSGTALRRLTGRERPPYRPMLRLHIAGGALGLLSGAAAAILRKGTRRHAAAGNVFFGAMLTMSASAVYVAATSPDGAVINILMGFLTAYLVTTSWWTARRREEATGLFDRVALLAALAVSSGLLSYGVAAANSASGRKDGIPATIYLVFGAVALLAAGLDLRMIARGGVSGPSRLARHLWRMCVALFIAVMSFFQGQPQVFPEAIRESGALGVPGLLVVLLMIFWLVRVRRGRRFRGSAALRPKWAAGPART